MVLEVTACRHATAVDVETLRRLLATVFQADPSVLEPLALMGEGRYALHVGAEADDVAEALQLAVFRWRSATTLLELQGWRLHRAEVVPRGQFEQESYLVWDG